MRLDWSEVFAPDHPALAGHFPGQPIVPGVVLLDVVLQALAAAPGAPIAVRRISNAKFLRPVAPGEALDFSCEWESGRPARFSIACGGARVATGTLGAA